MRKFRPLGLLAVGILVYSMVFSGCSGSGAITVTLSTNETSLNPGQTATIIATLTNDRADQGVTWTLVGPGTLSGNTTTSVVYTAPSTVAVATSATITATSVGNTTVTATQSISLVAVLTITTTSLPGGILGVPYDSFINAAGAPAPFTWTIISGSLPPGLTFQTTSTSTSAEILGTPTVLGTSNFTVQVEDSSDAIVTQALSIVINRPPPLSVATGSLPAGTVNVPYSQTLQASSGVQPYTWSLADGTLLPAGLTLASSGVISGTPIATGTTNFTVQVTDSSTPAHQTANANLSITVNPGVTNNGRLSGNYAFSVRGFDPSGLFVAAGSFTADGAGNISSGIMDINDTTGSFPVNQTFVGTYSVGQNGLGFITFNIAPPGTGSRMFALSMMAGGNANIIEFDDSTGGGTRNSGVLLKQTISSLTGSYAFGFVGIDAGKNRFGEAGQFAIGSTGAISGFLDSDDAVSGVSANVGFSGKYTVASNGRGTLTVGNDSYVFYVVNATQLLAVEIDPFSPGLHPLVSGTILQQSANGSFGDGNLNAATVFELTALESASPQSQVGLFAGTGGGAFSLTSDQNSGGTLTSPAGTGTYSVATNGRVTFPTGSGFQNSLPILYLVTTNTAFIIGTDSAVSFGFLTPQSGSPFTSTSLSGTYAGGSLAPVESSISNVVSVAVAGSGAITVTADVSGVNGLSQSQTSGITSVAANGRAVLTVNGNTTDILYLVLPSQYFSLSTDATARVDNFGQ
ncbi:MAG: Ig domain-containing protein [Terriglobales bacterium]